MGSLGSDFWLGIVGYGSLLGHLWFWDLWLEELGCLGWGNRGAELGELVGLDYIIMASRS